MSGGTVAARALSIVGHPALLMPLAVWASAASRGAPAAFTGAATGAAALVAGVVIAYAAWQVRRGRWAHPDASAPRERTDLNVLLVLLLAGVAAVLAVRGGSAALVAGPASCAAVVAVALVLRRHLKLSLHAAFAAYAAALQWPQPVLLGLLAVLALAVGWSRLRLGRHTRAEVALGLACGTLAGAVSIGVAA